MGTKITVLVLMLAVLPLAACQHEASTGGAMPEAEDQSGGADGQSDRPRDVPLRDINEVMADHVDALMARDGVTGVAIGETPDGVPCIMIMVLELTETQRQALPDRIEGHPVCPFESGEIRPM